ncbi:Uncharacterized protein FWK35_00000036 [Aphis craccivora]|uniref:Uncharacterized protein n=1 Tax=Aphis craccivora TaxID=307492 RepID=A0A6G0ZQA1_APHCR|nr:Uncharacterized protein FWK35_00000036 [Aphis craccivora]
MRRIAGGKRHHRVITLSAAVSAQLPNSRALKRTIQRVCQIKQIATANLNVLNFETQYAFKNHYVEKKVTKYFEGLLENEFNTKNEELLSPLISYFECTWIGRLDKRGKRRSPLFSIDIWNCF